MFKYYRKLNFTKISTNQANIWHEQCIHWKKTEVFPCERNFIETYMEFQRHSTPEAFVLCLGNTCIFVFISLLCHTATADTHMHSTEPNPPPAFNASARW